MLRLFTLFGVLTLTSMMSVGCGSAGNAEMEQTPAEELKQIEEENAPEIPNP